MCLLFILVRNTQLDWLELHVCQLTRVNHKILGLAKSYIKRPEYDIRSVYFKKGMTPWKSHDSR